MSLPNIRDALETALASITPPIDIVHQNEEYEPIPDQPFCDVFLLPAEPGNSTVGQAYHQELGIMQVNLMYPAAAGTLDCAQRAELVRTTFRRGATFTDGGVTVMVNRTPEIGSGEQEGGRWKQIVKIRWQADVFAA